MLAEDVGVYVLLVDAVILRNARAEAGGVEDRARADDLVLRQLRIAAEDVGQDVDRVRDDDIGRVRCEGRDLRDDRLHDVDVRLREVEAGLPGLARDAGGEDDDIGIAGVPVRPGVDGDGRAERRALPDVERFAEGLLAVDVDHDDLGGQPLHGQRVRDGGTDRSGSDDGDFGHGIILRRADQTAQIYL